jgi:hypothetical protein
MTDTCCDLEIIFTIAMESEIKTMEKKCVEDFTEFIN